MLRVKCVAAGSIAEEGMVSPGEELLAVNGAPIYDIFDYMFHTSACKLELTFRGSDGDEWILEVEKPEDSDEDIGLVFESDLPGGPRACGNHCIFCFVDQLPGGMRESLYFKDDDIRLTFTNGNYVTLTNAARSDLERIVRYRLSPVNISVHTTDAALRARMLGRSEYCGPSHNRHSQSDQHNQPDQHSQPYQNSQPNQHSQPYQNSQPNQHDQPYQNSQSAQHDQPNQNCQPNKPYSPDNLDTCDILPKIRYLTESGISVNAQIVLCRHYNDGAELDRTLGDLCGLSDRLESVAVVPSGLTRHREGLARLEAYDSDGAAEVIRQVTKWQKIFMRAHGRRTVHASDEFYTLCAGRLPGNAAYEGYPQLENGVGMMALFKKQFGDGLRQLMHSKGYGAMRAHAPAAPPAYIFTGRAAAPLIRQCAERLRGALPGLVVEVVAVENAFFGSTVTVSGLLTGGDLLNQAKTIDFLPNARIFISKSMLKHGEEVFLDDYPLDMLRSALKMDIIAVDSDGFAFIRALLPAVGL
ncbi:MAG: DUF512 domain-containing protein [Oscillospiraceae bacterium]|nr:DUF512 domain-containing protein [Oscillospiraceae bacterium]